jgi:hypothetical protein
VLLKIRDGRRAQLALLVISATARRECSLRRLSDNRPDSLRAALKKTPDYAMLMDAAVPSGAFRIP